MYELLLERAEFLALLEAVDARAIVGIAREKLFPLDEEEHRAVVKQGIVQLGQRDLLDRDDQPRPDLLKLVRIVAYPQIVFLVVRHVQALGPQLFLLYQSHEGIVEQTFPTEGTHRLAIIPDIPLLLARAVQILELPEVLPTRSSVEISQEEFFQCNELARQGQSGAALEILRRAGMPAFEADALVTTMHQPVFSGDIAVLKCAHETIIDARDITILRDHTMTWSATQIVPGEP
ncbi:MAG TPA: hypothetical protein VHZ51_00105, partial [Ktedonobacteraceae bacterium]|nr:hypothetical protein [Ktedonobacteraceae bacterium]